jgi:hypothetical protein
MMESRAQRAKRRKKTREKTHEEARFSSYALCHALCALRACVGAVIRESLPNSASWIVAMLAAARFDWSRSGYLSVTDRATDSSRAEGIRAALRELGYIEGQNIVIEYRHAGGRGRDGYPELLADLVRLKVEVILVAGGTTPIRAAKNATKTIPIVMTGTGLDPVTAGFIESLARPAATLPALQP